MKTSTGSAIWSSRDSTCEASSTSRSVRMEATIRPVTASKPMCSLRQERRLLVPCFSTSHSTQLQPGTVNQQVDRPASRAGLCRQLQALGAPAEGREVRYRQVEAEQLEDRADQPLGLAQRQMEHRTQRQGCRYRQVGVMWLTARRRARNGFPGGD